MSQKFIEAVLSLYMKLVETEEIHIWRNDENRIFSKTHFFAENRLFHPLEGYRHPQTGRMPLDNFILIKNQPSCFTF